MNKLTLALLASAAALAIAPSALATTIPTGSNSLITEVNSTSGGPLIGSSGISASFTESAWTYNVAGDLAFEYTVTNSAPTVDFIDNMSTDYGAYANSSLALEYVSGDAVTGSYASNLVGSVQINFTGDLGSSAPPIGASGQNTSTFILFTNATADSAGPIYFQDGSQVSGTALIPTPEPSSLLLLGTGLLGLAFVAFRKAKSTGMVLSM